MNRPKQIFAAKDCSDFRRGIIRIGEASNKVAMIHKFHVKRIVKLRK